MMNERTGDGFDPQQIEAYLLGELDEAQVLALDAVLRADPLAREQFTRAIEIMSIVREEFRGREAQGSVQSGEPLLQDFDRLFSELLLAERNAKTMAVVVDPHGSDEPVQKQGDRPNLREIGSTAGYLITRPRVLGPIAAMLALALVLVVLLRPGSSPTVQPIAVNPDSNAPGKAVATPIVATLTGASDAQWESFDLGVGTLLHAGQTLTLTQGIAEITTNRGAVALLEAPCTIELIDSPNALRLVAGKLVGICETDASKGFLVQSSQMDVTDLGTRFGVYVDEEGQSLAEVFEGVIQAKPRNESSFEPIELNAGQVIAVNRVGKAIDRNRFEPDVFARLLDPYDGVTTLSGDIQWSSSALFIGRERPTWRAEEHVQIFQELPSAVVKSDIPLTTDVPWLDQRSATSQSNSSVPAGTMIRSYVVILNWGPDARLPDRVVNGEIHFEGQVLGVIASTEHNRQFAEAIGSAGPRVWQSAWALRPPLAVHGDQVILHEGGHAVSFRLDTTGRTPEDIATFRAFRVLVQVDKERGGINAD